MMTSLEKIRPIGWRSKIGVIVPASNTVNEAEFHKAAPDGVSFHFTRSPLHSDPAKDNFERMVNDLTKAMHDLRLAMSTMLHTPALQLRWPARRTGY